MSLTSTNTVMTLPIKKKRLSTTLVEVHKLRGYTIDSLREG